MRQYPLLYCHEILNKSCIFHTKKQQYLVTEVLMIFYTKYHTVQNFGGKKVWRIRTVESLAEKTLVN